jgi:hypothetical protein
MLAICACLAAWPAHALSVLPLDVTQLLAGAQDVAHVRCESNTVEPDATVGVITVTTFVVFDRVKGAAGARFVVRQPGGEMSGRVVDYHVPRFAVGGEYVLFVPTASKLGFASPVGFGQGVFEVQGSADGARKDVSNGRDFTALLAGGDAARMPAGIATRLAQSGSKRTRVDLADFMSVLRERVGTR